MQAEIDHSTAVLDEVYGVRNDLGLHQLGLAIRRVESNLRTKAFEDRLLYVPKRTGFSADPNILTLLVEPLYGKEPSVGVRELIQNAVDAVRELEAWNNKHGEPVASIGKPKTGYDVLVEFVEQKQGMWLLRVKDNGIGMKSDTIQNYFLRAGASFRFSPEYAKEFLNDNGQCIVPRAGRFGIGAFAIFLLGPTFKLWTRHVSADESSGFKLEASTNSQLIEIQRALDLPVGTTIELEISSEAARGLGLTRDKRLPHQIHPASLADWFCWDWPKVAWRTIGSTPQHHLLAGLQQKVVCPIRKAKQPPEWSVIRPQGFDAVHWTFSNAPTISCNGVVIGRPTQIGHSRLLDNARYDWPFLHGLRQPAIAVLDPEGKLPLTIQRYNLAETRLPFLDDLRRDVVASFIAHALICGPRSSSEALSMERRHPLQSKPCSNYHSHPPKNMLGSGLLRWCVTSTGMVPAEDPWLCKLLNAKTCVVFGGLGLARETARPIEYISIPKMLEEVGSNEHALLPWYGSIAAFSQQPRINLRWDTLKCFVEELSGKGVAALGHTAKTNRLFFSVKRSNIEDTILKDLAAWTPSERDDKERCYFQLESDSAASPSNLKHCLAALETAQWIENGPLRGPGNVTLNGLNDLEVLFVAEVTINGVDSPQSALAQVWNDFLGPQIIPFDLAAREALIAEASKNAELKRHIEAWREMKRARSKWTPQ